MKVTQELIAQLRAQGLTIDAIHDKTGIATGTIAKWSAGIQEAPADKYKLLEGLLK